MVFTMKSILFSILIFVLPIRLIAQPLSYSSNGKMQPHNVEFRSHIKTKYDKTGFGVILVHIDTNSIKNEYPFQNEIKQYVHKNIVDSCEYFFLFNGSKENISIREHSREMAGNEVADTKKSGFR